MSSSVWDQPDHDASSDTGSNEESFQFVDIEAVESDGEGGNVSNYDDSNEDDESMDNFIASEDDIESEDASDANNSNLNHIQIRNKLNQQTDEESHKRQQLLDELTKPKESVSKHTQRPRYYDMVPNEATLINVSDSDSSESDSDCDQNSDYIDSSDDVHDDENECNQMDIDSNNTLSTLSELDFEKLISRTMVNLALELEQNEHKNTKQQINPFTTMQDEIKLETNHELNMEELLSFMSEDASFDINDAKEFESAIPFERSHNILPEPKPSSSNHPSNLRKAKLNTTTLSGDTFVDEEIRLAENTMKLAITRKMNMEQKNYAPPLSILDTRVKRRKKRENTGKLWFNMSAGKLTPQNKMHFLMLKYRHMLYRKYKPAKVKDEYVPKYFQMGTIIEGPTEFYSSRLKNRERRSSWANEYLSNASTKEWLEEKTRRAQRRIRRPGAKFWAPLRKLHVNNRYKLRKRIVQNRKKVSRINRKLNKRAKR